MEPMQWEYIGALGGVIGIGWLVVVPMYRGWTHLNDKMTARVKRSILMMAECEERRHPLGTGGGASGAPARSAEAPLTAPGGPQSPRSP